MSCPVELLDTSCKERKKYFEAYWDSGSCHVGDEAVGEHWEGRKLGSSMTPRHKHQCPWKLGCETSRRMMEKKRKTTGSCFYTF